ncbi:unnamed protein product, partial [Haemonchus placei]|uniref:DUF1758 domain-containing protein n=1 Tax=Haemonchus placei TaxID=6290 RepID=A0A0N4XBP7_HAEPC
MNPTDNSKKVDTVAFLDSGSSHTYITTEIAEKLELHHTTPETITLHTFGTSSPTTLKSHLHTIQVQLSDGTPYMISAQSLPLLTKALKIPASPLDHLLIDVYGADIPTMSTTPGILIGMDHFWNLVLSPSFYSITLPNGYYLLNTRLGKAKNSTREQSTQQSKAPRIIHSIKRMPNNFDHSLACLRSNWKTLAKKPSYLDRYNEIIQDQLRRGIIGEPPPTLDQTSGMNCREWTSSNKEVNETLQSLEQTPIDKNTKLLGLAWDVTSDTIFIRLPFLEKQLEYPTKRQILKIVASIYDPLGLISPITIVAKIFLQSLWKDHLRWDELLLEDQQNKWRSITSSWTQPFMAFPRAILPHETTSNDIQLHIFTDASQQAYCAVAYLRIEHGQNVNVKLLMGRTRLTPLHNTVTIPRLEL